MEHKPRDRAIIEALSGTGARADELGQRRLLDAGWQARRAHDPGRPADEILIMSDVASRPDNRTPYGPGDRQSSSAVYRHYCSERCPKMPGAGRKSIFAVPFGCLVAIATHFVRFGDEHAFGGNANEALVSLAIGGSITIALVILHAFLIGGSTTVTGTIARTRVGALLPNAPTIFTLAAAVYYGIETLEGNGVRRWSWH